MICESTYQPGRAKLFADISVVVDSVSGLRYDLMAEVDTEGW